MSKSSHEYSPVAIEHKIDIARDRYRRYYELNDFDHIMPQDQFEAMIEDEAVLSQILRVSDIARRVVGPALAEFAEADESERQTAYYELAKAMTHYYLLTCPCPAPDQHPGILAAERRWGVKHVGRNPDGSVSVWLSGRPSDPDESGDVYRGQQLVSAESLNDREAKDVWNWLGPEGLIVHTAGAANLYQNIMAAARVTIGDHPQNRVQTEIKGANVYDGAISLWLHDHGRMVSHNPLQHMVIGQMISLDANVPEHQRQDHDLPTLTRLHQDEPLFSPEDIDGIARHFGATSIIWNLADMFSKFIEIMPAEERAVTEDPSKFIQVRQPGTEMRFLTQRNLKYNNQKINEFYRRQIVLVQSGLAWLSSEDGLGIHPDTVQRAFFLTDDYMREYMREKKLSFYLSEFP